VWKTPIDAKHNWWGYNETLAVMGRICDHSDDPDLLEVDFRPFHMNNRSILSGKCPPGWSQVGDTCYIYIGAPMRFEDARSFCRVSVKIRKLWLICFLVLLMTFYQLYKLCDTE
jgi:hypothetical protein